MNNDNDIQNNLDEKICYSCHESYIDGDIFCHNCGTKIRNDKYIFSNDKKVYSGLVNKKNNNTRLVVGILLTLVYFILTIIFGVLNQPDDTQNTIPGLVKSGIIYLPFLVSGIILIVSKSKNYQFVEDPEYETKVKENQKYMVYIKDNSNLGELIFYIFIIIIGLLCSYIAYKFGYDLGSCHCI